LTAAATGTTRPQAGPPRDYRFPFFERVTLDNGRPPEAVLAILK